MEAKEEGSSNVNVGLSLDFTIHEEKEQVFYFDPDELKHELEYWRAVRKHTVLHKKAELLVQILDSVAKELESLDAIILAGKGKYDRFEEETVIHG
jgi:hypothetical protein